MSNNRLLLDTHVWLWLMDGDQRLAKSKKALKEINSALTDNSLCLSAISVWEVAMLEAKGRLSFSLNINEWISDALDTAGLSIVALLPSISIESANLPGDFHGDPADRIIAATALHENLTLVTADKNILTYSKKGYIKCLGVK